jgi:hypothetical protein
MSTIAGVTDIMFTAIDRRKLRHLTGIKVETKAPRAQAQICIRMHGLFGEVLGKRASQLPFYNMNPAG